MNSDRERITGKPEVTISSTLATHQFSGRRVCSEAFSDEVLTFGAMN
jgi:hypothetical protein